MTTVAELRKKLEAFPGDMEIVDFWEDYRDEFYIGTCDPVVLLMEKYPTPEGEPDVRQPLRATDHDLPKTQYLYLNFIFPE